METNPERAGVRLVTDDGGRPILDDDGLMQYQDVPPGEAPDAKTPEEAKPTAKPQGRRRAKS